MLDIYVCNDLCGTLFKSDMIKYQYLFSYEKQCLAQNAVSLTMPVKMSDYPHNFKLHPIFDMNLPEGALLERLRGQFSKVFPNFDDLALLRIIGKSQIGRLRFLESNEDPAQIPTYDLNELMLHDGTDGLFEDLLERYAQSSGISGVQPKVMVKAKNNINLEYLHYKGATHIIKTWNKDDYPELAANEFFCMRAALHAKLIVPEFQLSNNGKFLVITRFDLENGTYLGFEDFCVLNGLTSDRKYDGSYEQVCKRIKQFVSPEYIYIALEQFFKAITLSCVIKNGDAHLKNFGVLYSDTLKSVRLSPIYDLVSTTVYKKNDTLALLLNGSKKWPTFEKIIQFGRTHCDLTNVRLQELVHDVYNGVQIAIGELNEYMAKNKSFRLIGTKILSEWTTGLKTIEK